MLDNSYFFSLGPFHLTGIWGKYWDIKSISKAGTILSIKFYCVGQR